MSNQTDTSQYVLIVDDVPENIKIVASILHKQGYKLFFATNGSDALDTLNVEPVDLILLDVMMPGMDGFQVCEQLKQNPETHDIPVIFLTARTDTEGILKGFTLGAVDFVTKPFNSAELLARVKTHLSLRRAKQELQKANSTKDKFFSIIAHDLRSPFTALLGLAELIVTKIDIYKKEELRRIAHELQTSAKAVHTLLENLLTWSRIQRNAIEYFPEKVSLGEIVTHNILLFQGGATHKEISMSSHISDELMVYADYHMIDTILRNLLSNALKFTESGGNIEISSHTNQNTVEILVSDTGIGIPEQDIAGLFRIDVRHSHPGTAGEKGTGLGLILCKDLVEKNGGEIWVESEIGKGSTFKFSLPLKPSE